MRSRLLGTSRRKVGSRQRWLGVVRRTRDVDPGDSDLVAMAKQLALVHWNARRHQPDLQWNLALESRFGHASSRVTGVRRPSPGEEIAATSLRPAAAGLRRNYSKKLIVDPPTLEPTV